MKKKRGHFKKKRGHFKKKPGHFKKKLSHFKKKPDHFKKKPDHLKRNRVILSKKPCHLKSNQKFLPFLPLLGPICEFGSLTINSFLRKVKAISGPLGQNSDTVPLRNNFFCALPKGWPIIIFFKRASNLCIVRMKPA